MLRLRLRHLPKVGLRQCHRRPLGHVPATRATASASTQDGHLEFWVGRRQGGRLCRGRGAAAGPRSGTSSAPPSMPPAAGPTHLPGRCGQPLQRPLGPGRARSTTARMSRRRFRFRPEKPSRDAVPDRPARATATRLRGHFVSETLLRQDRPPGHLRPGPVTPSELATSCSGGEPPRGDGLVAYWDTTRGLHRPTASATSSSDVGPHGLHAKGVQPPGPWPDRLELERPQ